MKTIKIKKLSLYNFKGIRDFKAEFENQSTSIFGDNETGKTTLFDAFIWVLFGKNSEGDSQFGIKTLDENNNVIPKLEHSVEGIFEIDGQIVTLKRILKEKWVKKRGEELPVFTGNETTYFWNDVPMLAKDYAKKINEMMDESVFKLLTNPLYFNSLPWQDRREILTEMSGEVSDQDIAQGNQEYITLLAGLGSLTIEESQKAYAIKRKTIKDELKMIPTRIDEVDRSMPEVIDFKPIKTDIDLFNSHLIDIDKKIANKNEAVSGA